MFIKICGITNIEDAQFAVDGGATALGFIFYPKSPRYIDPREVKKIISTLSDNVAKVGVFVDSSIENVNTIAAEIGLTHVQLHGNEDADYSRAMETKVIRAFRIGQREDLDKMKSYPAQFFLLDTFVPGKYGGTGQSFDWKLAVEAKKFGTPIILSGGLTPKNVSDAVCIVEPAGVDVSSGVELEPGRKDKEKVKIFLNNAISAFQNIMF